METETQPDSGYFTVTLVYQYMTVTTTVQVPLGGDDDDSAIDVAEAFLRDEYGITAPYQDGDVYCEGYEVVS
jgi:hypothetical protein